MHQTDSFTDTKHLIFSLNQILSTFLSSTDLMIKTPVCEIINLIPKTFSLESVNLYRSPIEELDAKSVFFYHTNGKITIKEKLNSKIVKNVDNSELQTIEDSWFYYLIVEKNNEFLNQLGIKADNGIVLYYLDPYETAWYLVFTGSINYTSLDEREIYNLSILFHFIVNLVQIGESKYLTKMGKSFYERVVAKSNKAVFIHEKGIILDANHSAVLLLRANNVNQLKYQHLREFVDESYRELLVSRIASQEQTGKDSPPLYYKLKKINGEPIEVLMSGLCVDYKGRTVTVSIVDELTEIEKVNQVQANLSNNFLDFTKNSGDAIFALDFKFKLIEANPSFTNIFGNQIVSLKQIFVNPNDALEFYTLMRKNQINKYESTLKTKEGIHLDCLISTNSWNYGGINPGFQGVVRINTDSSDVVKSMGRERLRIMSEMSSGIAHEFNNILMAIQGFVENAIYEPFEPNSMEYELSNILNVTERASNLAKSLLIFSGKAHFEKESVEINDLLDSLQPILKVSYESIKLSIAHHDTELYSMMEKTQINEMLLNILGLLNDVDTKDQKIVLIRPNVEIITLETQHHLFLEQDLKMGMYNTIEITHNIPNLTKQKAEELFTPFFSLKNHDKSLSLSTSVGILKSHGGGLEIQNRNNMCVGVKIYLPVAKIKSKFDNSLPEELKEEADPSRMILLCDDERALLSVTGRMLERLGLTVITAEDGVHALEIFKMNHDFLQLVILDMTMPKMSGKETLAEMQKINPDIPILISSGYSEFDISTEFSDSTIAGILVKPYRFNDLKKKIENILHVNLLS